MRKPHRKRLLAWLLTAALLLSNLPVSVLSEEVVENPIQTEIVEQDEQKASEETALPDSPPEETGEPIEPPVSEEPDEMPDSGGQSETAEIPTDENNPDIPDQDESETPEPSDSGIEETPSPEVPEETPDTDSTDEPPAEEVPAEETPIPEESPLPDDEEAFSVSEALLEYGYAYAAAYAESVIYEDAALTAPLFTLKEDGGVLLITEETETAFKVWWITYADEPLSGYIAKSDIFQDVTLFNDTVMNNIRLGNPNATDDQVIAAAKAAYCDEFVREMPDGYQTVLGENGNTLSGGERQRISIARALLKNAPIILLDEATASLDPENEVLVQKAIARLVEGKTVIMIAHCLRTVVDADQIRVLDNGRLVEHGTHDELMKKNGLYHKLFHIQQESLGWAV